MYWFKVPKYFYVAVCIIALMLQTACSKNDKPVNQTLKYFDLKKYFNDESLRLAKNNKSIQKTAAYNNKVQTKKVLIGNWQQELSLFAESDINKPAWRDSYNIMANADWLIYEAKSTDSRTRKITIHLKNKRVSGVLIYNVNKNPLYQTEEYLAYYPDSLYSIDKSQKIKILGENNYKISGRFK